MRHGKKVNHLGRKASHRKAMLSNMATSLIQNKRIVTTVAKAKELRKYVEPIITKSKTDTTHSRRVVFSYLQNKESVNILFNEVSEKVADREGGYTRILKTGNRLGDNASMCVIELVDYNESLLKEAKPKKTRRRRSRKGQGDQAEAAVAATAATAAVVEQTAGETETAGEEAAAEAAVAAEASEVVESPETEEKPVTEEPAAEAEASAEDTSTEEAGEEE